MARKKAATATVDAPHVPLEEQIKKLLERGKKRGTLTYEEVNAVFDNVEDVTPERVDELFEEIASLGIEVVSVGGAGYGGTPVDGLDAALDLVLDLPVDSVVLVKASRRVGLDRLSAALRDGVSSR